MECLNDFGTVNFFAVKTFTAGIFDVWFNMNNVAGAAQLAVVLLLFVLAMIALERRNRRNRRFHHTTGRYRPLPGYPLPGLRGLGAFLACLLPVALGFLIPCGVLLRNAVVHFSDAVEARILDHAVNSLLLSGSAALLTVAVGLFMAYGLRLRNEASLRALGRFASLGYAVPGAVLAIGVMIPLASFDNAVDAVVRAQFGISTGLLLSGTVVALILGYTVRFLALSFGTIEAGLTKITPHMDDAARTLGHGPGATLKRVHLPMLRASVLTAAILVFVDCMKELPMTLFMRPFNFETLATHVYQYAGRELIERASLGALLIVAAGILPVVLLSRTMGRSRPGEGLVEI